MPHMPGMRTTSIERSSVFWQKLVRAAASLCSSYWIGIILFWSTMTELGNCEQVELVVGIIISLRLDRYRLLFKSMFNV